MNFDELFLELFCNLPALITLLIAQVLTLAGWQRHPPAARWAMLGFSWLFVTYLLQIFWRTVGIGLVFANNPPIDFEELFCLLLLSACEAAAYFFFLVALSVARSPYPPRHYYEDEPEETDLRRPS